MCPLSKLLSGGARLQAETMPLEGSVESAWEGWGQEMQRPEGSCHSPSVVYDSFLPNARHAAFVTCGVCATSLRPRFLTGNPGHR